jgi:hypothetical protein
MIAKLQGEFNLEMVTVLDQALQSCCHWLIKCLDMIKAFRDFIVFSKIKVLMMISPRAV